ncbi:MAG: hypothetical protein HC927_02265 [Deltaproteobacteria bacterium]|nr:hypothetical protein [Deltaproteobacteria bacterium]
MSAFERLRGDRRAAGGGVERGRGRAQRPDRAHPGRVRVQAARSAGRHPLLRRAEYERESDVESCIKGEYNKHDYCVQFRNRILEE